jgi:hypothetical protein
MKWKRPLLLLPVLASVLFVTVLAEPDAVGKIGKGIAVALKMPLALLAARSPGEREPGMLRLTKGAGPEERVLPTVRDREGEGPDAGNPIFGNPDAFNPIAPGPSSSNALSAPDAGASPFAPNFGQPSFPGFLIPGGSRSNSDQPPPQGPTDLPPVTENPPGSTPEGPIDLPPPEGPITPPPDVPPGGPNPPDGPNPPGEPNPPDGPPTLVIPEPATWTITGFGLLAAGLFWRRRAARKQSRVTAA